MGASGFFMYQTDVVLIHFKEILRTMYIRFLICVQSEWTEQTIEETEKC